MRRASRVRAGEAAGLAAALVLAVLPAACGDDGPTGGGPRTVEVEVLDEANAGGTFGSFRPASVVVRPGDTVRWVQRGAAFHTVTEGSRGDPTPAFNADLDQPGETFEQAFPSPGTFPYHCRPHPGMDGTVVVAAGD